MKIVYVFNEYDPMDGCAFVRVIVPSKELKKRGHELKMTIFKGSVPLEVLNWADVVIFNRGYSSDDLSPLFGLLKILKKKIVYDVDDDFLALPDWHPIKPKVEKYQKILNQLPTNADLITTTTDYLADIFKERYQKEVVVIPNAIDFERFLLRPKNSEKLRIGWSGGYSHILDLLLIVDVIKALQEKYNFIFLVQGISVHPLEAQIFVWQDQIQKGLVEKVYIDFLEKALELWEKLKSLKKFFFIPFYPAEMYPEILRKMDLDIGICPLEDNQFNKSKSCIKFYEYASVGATTLASDVGPYNLEVNYLAKNNFQDWYEKLEKLIINTKFREKLLKEQRKFVLENRDIKKVSDVWEKTLLNYGNIKTN